MESSKKSASQKVVVLDKALKLAEGWVKQMNAEQGSAEDVGEEKIQTRPPRLGLGAKFVPHSQFAATLNPVEKKLRAKLNAAKRQSALGTEESCSIDGDSRVHKLKCNDVSDDDDDSDSRTNAFKKKQETCSVNFRQNLVTSGKKRKRKQKQTK